MKNPDRLDDTPEFATLWCPDCNPERDPIKEILVEDYCGAHRPSLEGLDDAKTGEARPLGNAETDGVTQREMSALLRGGFTFINDC